MDYTHSHATESVLIFPLLNWRMIEDFSAFTFKHDAAKDSIRTCRIVNK